MGLESFQDLSGIQSDSSDQCTYFVVAVVASCLMIQSISIDSKATPFNPVDAGVGAGTKGRKRSDN